MKYSQEEGYSQPLRDEIEKKLRKDFDGALGDSRFRGPIPLEKEFSTGINPFRDWRFYSIPQGWSQVTLRWGGKAYKGFTNKSQEREDRVPRPVKGSGIYFMNGLDTLVKSVYIVNTQLQTQDLRARNMVTADGVTLPDIDAALDFEVIDPIQAMTGTSHDYREALFNRALRRLVGEVGDQSLKELATTGEHERNYAFKQRKPLGKNGDGKPIYSDELVVYEDLGVRLRSLSITEKNLEEKLRVLLAQEATSAAEAEGIRIKAKAEADREKVMADARKYAEQQDAAAERTKARSTYAAGKIIARSPEAMRLREIQMAEYMSEKSQSTVIPIPFDILSKLGGVMNPQPTTPPSQTPEKEKVKPVEEPAAESEERPLLYTAYGEEYKPE